jgi:8-hydroxy-5-deazaflavin:NADPH oxidoreductase
VDYFITGNDRDALNVVSELVTTTGFHPVIAGDLSRSRTLESMQFLLIQLNRHSKLNCLQ